MKLRLILSLIVISVSLGVLATISTGFLQQAIAHPKDFFIVNDHEHYNCDASGNCNIVRGIVENGPDGHENCNENTHRENVLKCNVQ